VEHTSLPMKLRVLRAERQLSLREASAQTGVDKVALSRYERGLGRPQDLTLAKIAKGYGVGVEELLEEAVPLAKAPEETGRPERKASVFDVALLAGRAQVEEDRKTFARAAASESAQGSFVPHLNEAMNRLREEYPVGDLAEGCVDLAHHAAQLEQENTRLIEELEVHRREAARQ
jgi:transcriptional regulator with XRE-family HTH domain